MSGLNLKSKVLILVALFLLTGIFIAGASSPKDRPNLTEVESGFISIPDSVQTSVYWYWISDNISREGVVKDLHAMKKIGINRAFIGNIGLGETPYGKVKIFTSEWWDILHTALKTATELNIQIGIFNSPGWSQSGGPWVKNEQSMRYLNSSELEVTGPLQFNQKLAAPNVDFQLVKIIAYKVPAEAGKPYRLFHPKISSAPEIDNLTAISDGDNKTEVALKQNNTLTIDFETAEAATVRTLTVKTSEKRTKAQGELLVKDETGFRSLKKFEINRSNPSINVGFDPFAPIVLAIPETKSKFFRLIISEVTVAGGIAEVELSPVPKLERYPEKSLAKMFQTPLPYWKDYLWPAQPVINVPAIVIDPKGVIDITKYRTPDGKLSWKVPPGRWKIMQTGMTTTGQTNGPATPEATGLETDKMSKKHIAAHFDAFLGEIIRRIPAADRKSWKVVVEDSYETGGQNWTDGLIEEFITEYGYSPVPFLPVFKGNVVGSQDLSDRFLWDLRRMVANKVSYDYVAGLREASHQHGLTTWLENYGHWGFPGEFLQYGGQSDEVGGEFWSEGDLGNIENRAASSCAHIYGKIKVSAESFTCGGKAYSRYPATMKPRGDRFFTEGINNTLMHVYIEQPDEREPGVNAGCGNEFNRHNTWFSYMDLFTHYLKRTNFMLQQGNYVADVAYFIGEDAPKMTGICEPALPQGYSFDYINGEVIKTRISVKDGRIVLPDGLSYRILVLPKLETMRPELLKKIKELVNQGAVVLGPAPKYSPSGKDYPASDLQVQKLAKELWGNVDGVKIKSARVGKGMILSGMEMQEALDLTGVLPDCKLGKDDAALFIHRTISDGEVYFISNQSDKTITINPELRVSGKAPELWMPTTGNIRDLPAFYQNGSSTIVPLKLEAYESQFIIFRKKAEKNGLTAVSANFPEGKMLAEAAGSWVVTFDHAKRGPARPVVFDKLSDWTLSENDSIKYYSGTAVYKIAINLPQIASDKKIILQIGQLTAMAKVKVNGVAVGGAWTAPWQVDISAAVKSGTNQVEISVVNNWMNRLIGDQKLPAGQRPTWSPNIPYKSNSPLQPSGLLGPVRVIQTEFIR
ncbi:MAG: glycosyl hydrolase [Mariniphaga sp.]